MATRAIRRRFAASAEPGQHHKAGHKITIPSPTRRTGMVKNVVKHGLESWHRRGGGIGATYKD